jgi:hypothetical protein
MRGTNSFIASQLLSDWTANWRQIEKAGVGDSEF